MIIVIRSRAGTLFTRLSGDWIGICRGKINNNNNTKRGGRSNLVTGHDVTKADAAQRNEAEVAAVERVPRLPVTEQGGPE